MRTTRPLLDLVGDQRVWAVDHVGRELDAAVHRPGMHQELARAEAAAVDLEAHRVLADRGHEALTHPLVLHAERIDDVRLGEAVEVVS